MGWPGWAGAAAGAIYFLIFRELAGPEQAQLVHWIGVGTFVLCVGILLFGKRIERTLEILNWVLVAVIIGGFLILAVAFVSADTWVAAGAGLIGYDTAAGSFRFIPEGVDWFLIGAFAAYSGAGGVINLTLSNWARDKGYGMGERAGYIPSAMGGKRKRLAPTGYTFDPTPDAMARWKGWWRIVRADQWVVYFIGAMLGMILPAVLYVTFIEGGTDIRGLSVAAALANAMASQAGAIFGGAIALMGVWVLFKTQLGHHRSMTRSITDILWTGSRWVRSLRGGDVRFVYYTVLGLLTVWGPSRWVSRHRYSCCSWAPTWRASSSWSRRCTCSTSTRGYCRRRSGLRCGDGWRWWRCRRSTRRSWYCGCGGWLRGNRPERGPRGSLSATCAFGTFGTGPRALAFFWGSAAAGDRRHHVGARFTADPAKWIEGHAAGAGTHANATFGGNDFPVKDHSTVGVGCHHPRLRLPTVTKKSMASALRIDDDTGQRQSETYRADQYEVSVLVQ